MLQRSDFNENYYINGGEIGGYTNYCEESYFNERPDLLVTKIKNKLTEKSLSLEDKKILVIGCAYGYSIKYFRQLGADAYGMDFSEYAISRVEDDLKPYVFLGDARNEQDIINIKEAIDLQGKFDIIIDEDMLCCLTDSEAINFKTLAFNHSKFLVHIITENNTLSEWYNYKSIDSWKSLLGVTPKELWFSRFNWE